VAMKPPTTRPKVSIPQLAPSVYGVPEGAFGLPPADTHPALQQDVFKELVNKLAWVKSPARQYALRIVKAVVRDNGYPLKIGKNGPEELD